MPRATGRRGWTRRLRYAKSFSKLFSPGHDHTEAGSWLRSSKVTSNSSGGTGEGLNAKYGGSRITRRKSGGRLLPIPRQSFGEEVAELQRRMREHGWPRIGLGVLG